LMVASEEFGTVAFFIERCPPKLSAPDNKRAFYEASGFQI